MARALTGKSHTIRRRRSHASCTPSCLRSSDKDGLPADMDENRCTDVACLGLFMLFWAGMLIIAAMCVPTGDINGLSYGSDYLGNRCGTGKFADRKRVWFPQLSKDLALQHALKPWQLSLYGLCVSECPKVSTGSITDYGDGHMWTPYIDTFQALYYCVPKQTVNASIIKLCMQPTCHALNKPCAGATHGSRFANAWVMHGVSGECGRETDITESYVTKQPMGSIAMDYILNFASTMDTVVGAMSDNWRSILMYGAALPTAMGIGWMLFLYMCSWFAVYLALVVLVLVLVVSFGVCAFKGGLTPPIVNQFVNTTFSGFESKIEDSLAVEIFDNPLLQSYMSVDEDWTQLYQGLAALMGVLLLLLLMFICMAAEQIVVTTNLVKISTRVVRNSVGMVVFPLLTVAAQIALIAFGLGVIFFLFGQQPQTYGEKIGRWKHVIEQSAASVEDISGIDAVIPDFNQEDFKLYGSLYILFGMLWTYQFLLAIELTTISGCVYYYYFVDHDTAQVKDKRFDDNQTDFVVATMFSQVLKYNLGTMAFGSFVLAVTDSVRIVMEWIEARIESAGNVGGVCKLATSCARCFLACFHHCFKFVSGYAYVFVIMENVGFCPACYDTFAILSKHTAQITITKVVQTVLYWLQSISIPIICTIIAYNEAMEGSRQEGRVLTNDMYMASLAPAVAVLVLSFILARCFASVYEQTVSALTVCVLNDISHYNCMFTPDEVLDAFKLDKVAIDTSKDLSTFDDAPLSRVRVKGNKKSTRYTQL